MSVPQDKKTVLVTGCTPGGIGHALCLKFHASGYHVIATARRPEVLDGLRDMGMTTIGLNVDQQSSINECVAQVTKLTGGTLDILVNNAGVMAHMPAADIDLDDVRTMFETNVFAVMAMVKAFVPLLIPARGLILQVSSIAGVVADLYASGYSATKGALTSYSRTLRLELKPFNVRVMIAHTGTVKSNLTTKFHSPLPEGSIYKPVEDMVLKRHEFSQENFPMDTDVFAGKIVRAAVKGEGWFGGWFGRTPDWIWTGGLARRTWLGTYFPDSWMEALVGMLSEDDVITAKIHAAAAAEAKGE